MWLRWRLSEYLCLTRWMMFFFPRPYRYKGQGNITFNKVSHRFFGLFVNMNTMWMPWVTHIMSEYGLIHTNEMSLRHKWLHCSGDAACPDLDYKCHWSLRVSKPKCRCRCVALMVIVLENTESICVPLLWKLRLLSLRHELKLVLVMKAEQTSYSCNGIHSVSKSSPVVFFK